MSYLDLGPRLKEYTPAKIGEYLDLIQLAYNNITKANFRKLINGNDIIAKQSMDLNRLKWKEFPIKLCDAVLVYATTSTTGDDIGDYFAWDPNKFPGGLWYLEASICTANAAATATLTLKGQNVIGSVTSTSTSLERVRSGALTMPTDASQNIWLNIKTSNASYAAKFAGARLIFVPM